MLQTAIRPPPPAPPWLALSAPSATQRVRDVVLVFAPVPVDVSRDSAFAVRMAVHVRDRLRRWRPNVVHTIRLCERTNLCEALLRDAAVPNLTFSMAADFYVVGRLRRTGTAPTVDRSTGIPTTEAWHAC